MLSCSSRLTCVVREINGGSLKEVSEEGAGKKKAHAMALYIHETHRPDCGWSPAPESIRTRLLRLSRLRLQLRAQRGFEPVVHRDHRVARIVEACMDADDDAGAFVDHR